MGSALARQRVQLQNQQQALQARLQATSSPKVISHVQAKITALQAQQQMLEPDHQDYTLSLHALSQAIHPFHSIPVNPSWHWSYRPACKSTCPP
jgi:hypothetical protein